MPGNSLSNGGDVSIHAGASSNGAGGNVVVSGGSSATQDGGDITMLSGSSVGGSSGAVNIKSGGKASSSSAAVEDQVPLPQFLHLESFMFFSSLEYLPATHSVHATVFTTFANPSPSLYRPAMQFLHSSLKLLLKIIFQREKYIHSYVLSKKSG